MPSEKVVKDKSISILLDRREEIRNTINKLEEEYSAIGDILTRVYNYEQNKKKAEQDKLLERE